MGHCSINNMGTGDILLIRDRFRLKIEHVSLPVPR